MATTMGQIIKNLRKGRGFTQEELAERLGVTYQAISKWENDSGMPDISQIVPLASIFDVSTDFLFGIDNTSETEEALKIVSSADSIQEYGKLDTYLKAYDILLDGLKKYPNNYMITYNCMNLGVLQQFAAEVILQIILIGALLLCRSARGLTMRPSPIRRL